MFCTILYSSLLFLSAGTYRHHIYCHNKNFC
uniref:Uncharacterized protein n=1 Tax=Arundo donax TaxID=35708 RepID=A0A0A8Z8K9_ARUDO